MDQEFVWTLSDRRVRPDYGLKWPNFNPTSAGIVLGLRPERFLKWRNSKMMFLFWATFPLPNICQRCCREGRHLMLQHTAVTSCHRCTPNPHPLQSRSGAKKIFCFSGRKQDKIKWLDLSASWYECHCFLAINQLTMSFEHIYIFTMVGMWYHG